MAGCLVVVSGIAAAWIGCRDDYGVEDDERGLDPGIGTGSGTDAAIDAPIDGSGSGIDAPLDAFEGPIDAAVDAGGGGGGDAGGNDLRPFDRTSFYACAEGGCGSTTGAEVWLPLAIAIGFALRRPRARRTATPSAPAAPPR